MKKLIILSAIAMSGLIYSTANAQIGIRVGLRLGSPVAYTPVMNAVDEPVPVYNDGDDDFYYLPDLGVYYDVDAQCYYYFDGESWISAAYLPGAYCDYDWSSARRFEVREPQPYLRDDFYRSRYEGRRIGDWGRRDNDNHFNNGGYAGRRDNDNRFDNGGYANRRDNDQHFGNRWGRGNDERFNNRGQGGYGQPSQPNRGNDERFNNRGQGGYGQPSQPNRGQGGYGQPSNQNRGQNTDKKSGNEHFTQTNPKGGYGDHKMTKF